MKIGHQFPASFRSAYVHRFHAQSACALELGGRPAIAELVPDTDHVSPPTTATLSMMMLAPTPTGHAYTFGELESISTNADFSRLELAPPEIVLDQLGCGAAEVKEVGTGVPLRGFHLLISTPTYIGSGERNWHPTFRVKTS